MVLEKSPLAENPPGAYGDFRLQDLIAGAQRIDSGVDKGQMRAFCNFSEIPEYRKRSESAQDRKKDQPVLHPGQKHQRTRGGRNVMVVPCRVEG